MAENENVTVDSDGLPVVTVTAEKRYRCYDINKILNQNFLKSSRFCVQFPALSKTIAGDYSGITAEELTFLCDSVEFPGQSLTTTEYRIPGKLKLKVPYLRELNEVTFTFYHNSKLPIYEIFAKWIQTTSNRNTENRYFDDLVCPKIKIIQFDESAGIRGFIRDIFDFNSSATGGVDKNLSKYMTVQLTNAFPLNFASMPSNWADDGFHKMTVSFFYEDVSVETGIKNLTFKNLMDSGNIVDPPIRNTRQSLEFFSTDSGTRNA